MNIRKKCEAIRWVFRKRTRNREVDFFIFPSIPNALLAQLQNDPKIDNSLSIFIFCYLFLFVLQIYCKWRFGLILPE